MPDAHRLQKDFSAIFTVTATRNPRGVFFHAGMARQPGAAREEVTGAVVMNLYLCGLAPVPDCLPSALEGYDRGDLPG